MHNFLWLEAKGLKWMNEWWGGEMRENIGDWQRESYISSSKNHEEEFQLLLDRIGNCKKSFFYLFSIQSCRRVPASHSKKKGICLDASYTMEEVKRWNIEGGPLFFMKYSSGLILRSNICSLCVPDWYLKCLGDTQRLLGAAFSAPYTSYMYYKNKSHYNERVSHLGVAGMQYCKRPHLLHHVLTFHRWLALFLEVLRSQRLLRWSQIPV